MSRVRRASGRERSLANSEETMPASSVRHVVITMSARALAQKTASTSLVYAPVPMAQPQGSKSFE